MNKNFKELVNNKEIESYLIKIFSELCKIHAHIGFLHTYCTAFAHLDAVYYFVPFTKNLENFVKEILLDFQNLFNINKSENDKFIFKTYKEIHIDNIYIDKFEQKILYDKLCLIYNKTNELYRNLKFLNNYCTAYSDLKGVYYFTPFTEFITELVNSIDFQLYTITQTSDKNDMLTEKFLNNFGKISSHQEIIFEDD